MTVVLVTHWPSSSCRGPRSNQSRGTNLGGRLQPGRVERRHPVEMALQKAHPLAAKDVGLVLGLDPLGDGGKAEAFGKAEQVAEEHLAFAVGRDVADEGAV